MAEYFRRLETVAQWSSVEATKTDLFAGTGLFAGLNCFEPGQHQRVHVHQGADKFYFVVSGKARITVSDETREVAAGTVVWAPAGSDRADRALSGDRPTTPRSSAILGSRSSRGHHSAVDLEQPVERSAPRMVPLGVLARLVPHRRPRAGQQRHRSRRQCPNLPGGEDGTGTRSRHPLRHPSHIGAEDRRAAGHRFGGGQAEGFGWGRRHVEIGRREQIGQGLAIR
jgi:uncharacterized RmlC-like cupin family protein